MMLKREANSSNPSPWRNHFASLSMLMALQTPNSASGKVMQNTVCETRMRSVEKCMREL